MVVKTQRVDHGRRQRQVGLGVEVQVFQLLFAEMEVGAVDHAFVAGQPVRVFTSGQLASVEQTAPRG